MRDFMSITSIPKIHEPRKLSEAFDFKRGEQFKGNIESVSGDGRTVKLKLKDGTEFMAKLDMPLKDIVDGLTNFEVVGFEKGQVKLRVVNDDILKQHSKTLNDSLELILNKFGLETDKKQLLEKMLKFNIPITKENLELLNTLTDFRDKALTSPKDIKGFIEHYIASKGNEIPLEQKTVIEGKLNEFFKSFSKMSDNDIMTFLENDMEFNTVNLKSFNNVTKGENNVFRGLEGAILELENLDAHKSLVNDNALVNNKNIMVDENGKEIGKLSENVVNRSGENHENELFVSKDNQSLLDSEILKDVVDNRESVVTLKHTGALSESFKNIDEQIKQAKTEVKSLIDLGNGVLRSEDAKEVLKNLEVNLKVISKEVPVSEKLIAVVDKVIKNFDNLDKGSLESLKNVFEFAKKEVIKLEQDFATVVKDKFGENSTTGDKNQVKEIDIFLKEFKEVKLGLAQKQEQMKEAIKTLVDKVSSNNEGASQMVMAVLKDKIADFKMFNDLSNEYYYLDVPLNMNEQEYPCKLVIKDERKDGKKLDGKNIKLAVSVKTVHIGSVDALINVSDKNIKIELKVLKQNMNLLEKNKDSLHKALEQLSFMPYIFVSEKKEIVESSISDFREFFSEENTLGLDKKV